MCLLDQHIIILYTKLSINDAMILLHLSCTLVCRLHLKLYIPCNVCLCVCIGGWSRVASIPLRFRWLPYFAIHNAVSKCSVRKRGESKVMVPSHNITWHYNHKPDRFFIGVGGATVSAGG